MKVKITYEYRYSNDYPFVAYAYLDDKLLEIGSSKVSFDEAKSELMTKVDIKIKTVPTVIPEPEEVEL